MTVSVFRHSCPEKAVCTAEGGRIQRQNGIFRNLLYYRGDQYTCTGYDYFTIERYATFKAMAKNAEKEDLIRLLRLTENNPDPKKIEYVRAVLTVSVALHENVMKEMERIMQAAFERVFRKELDEKKQEGALLMLASLVKDKILTLEDAAKRAGLSPAEFQAKTAGT